MATFSGTLAGRTPGTEDPGGLQSVGLQKVSHSRTAKHSTADEPHVMLFGRRVAWSDFEVSVWQPWEGNRLEVDS